MYKGDLNFRAVEVTLDKHPQLSSFAKSDGLTALHLSVLNDHESVTNFLIEKVFPIFYVHSRVENSVHIINSESEAASMSTRLLYGVQY